MGNSRLISGWLVGWEDGIRREDLIVRSISLVGVILMASLTDVADGLMDLSPSDSVISKDCLSRSFSLSR